MNRSQWMSNGLLIALAATLPAADDKAVTVPLGGLRQASATIRGNTDDYMIQVRFLPVRCFDALTNAALNREKGRLYALQALAKHLSGKDSATLTVSGVQVESTALDGKFQTLTLRVPRKAVALVPEEKNPPKEPVGKAKKERVAFSSDLFTRKREYHQTLDQLTRQFEAGVRALPKDEQAFNLAVAELEEKTVNNLVTLATEIGQDKLLLTVEKDELLEAVQQTKKTALDRLIKTVKRFETKPRSEKPQ